jgi:hypothetical protein
MAKIKNKVKKVKRNKVVRADVKVKVKKNILKTHGKNKEENAPEIIFDSEVGKTDALFVDEPKPEQPQPEDKVVVDQIKPEEIKVEDVGKKPWWKRIFS